MRFQPLDDRVLVKLLDQPKEQSSGRIIIPETAQRPQREAKVVAVGTDEELAELIKVGDRILIDQYSETPITIDDEELYIVERSGILGIFKEE
jgi:co-chaperonin GroES (HSP10)